MANVIVNPLGQPATLDAIPMTRDMVRVLAELETFRRQLGLSLYCVRCQALGMKDGVQGGNDPKGKEFVLACGCSVRKYVAP